MSRTATGAWALCNDEATIDLWRICVSVSDPTAAAWLFIHPAAVGQQDVLPSRPNAEQKIEVEMGAVFRGKFREFLSKAVKLIEADENNNKVLRIQKLAPEFYAEVGYRYVPTIEVNRSSVFFPHDGNPLVELEEFVSVHKAVSKGRAIKYPKHIFKDGIVHDSAQRRAHFYLQFGRAALKYYELHGPGEVMDGDFNEFYETFLSAQNAGPYEVVVPLVGIYNVDKPVGLTRGIELRQFSNEDKAKLGFVLRGGIYETTSLAEIGESRACLKYKYNKIAADRKLVPYRAIGDLPVTALRLVCNEFVGAVDVFDLPTHMGVGPIDGISTFGAGEIGLPPVKPYLLGSRYDFSSVDEDYYRRVVAKLFKLKKQNLLAGLAVALRGCEFFSVSAVRDAEFT